MNKPEYLNHYRLDIASEVADVLRRRRCPQGRIISFILAALIEDIEVYQEHTAYETHLYTYLYNRKNPEYMISLNVHSNNRDDSIGNYMFVLGYVDYGGGYLRDYNRTTDKWALEARTVLDDPWELAKIIVDAVCEELDVTLPS